MQSSNQGKVKKVKLSKAQFYDILWEIEGSSQQNPADNGDHIGPLQIGTPYWKDSGIGGEHDDVRDLATAKQAVDGYLKRYSKGNWNDSMTKSQVKRCAAIHNGGPSGATKDTFEEGYWDKWEDQLPSNIED